MKWNIVVGFLVLVGAVSTSLGQTPLSTTEVDWFNDSTTLLRDFNGALLTQGSANLNSDGDLVQLGYYAGATAANNFTGTWTPITGATSVGKTAIGDSFDLSGAGAGVLAFTTVFHFGTSTPIVFEAQGAGEYTTQSAVSISSTTPPTGQILSIRFYDTTAGTSGHYNAVSADNWAWQTPTDFGQVVLINMATSTLEWQDPTNPFKTSLSVIPVPEPSTYALFGLGAVGMMALRRRVKR
jgi:hypothetical protein